MKSPSLLAGTVIALAAGALVSGCVVRARTAPAPVAVSGGVYVSGNSDYATVYPSSFAPEPIPEIRPMPPGYGYVWVDGYWDWNGYDWTWSSGYWVPPRVGYAYIAPRYIYLDGRPVYYRGYWQGDNGYREYGYGGWRGAPPAAWRAQPQTAPHVWRAQPAHNTWRGTRPRRRRPLRRAAAGAVALRRPRLRLPRPALAGAQVRRRPLRPRLPAGAGWRAGGAAPAPAPAPAPGAGWRAGATPAPMPASTTTPSAPRAGGWRGPTPAPAPGTAPPAPAPAPRRRRLEGAEQPLAVGLGHAGWPSAGGGCPRRAAAGAPRPGRRLRLAIRRRDTAVCSRASAARLPVTRPAARRPATWARRGRRILPAAWARRILPRRRPASRPPPMGGGSSFGGGRPAPPPPSMGGGNSFGGGRPAAPPPSMGGGSSFRAPSTASPGGGRPSPSPVSAPRAPAPSRGGHQEVGSRVRRVRLWGGAPPPLTGCTATGPRPGGSPPGARARSWR